MLRKERAVKEAAVLKKQSGEQLTFSLRELELLSEALWVFYNECNSGAATDPKLKRARQLYRKIEDFLETRLLKLKSNQRRQAVSRGSKQ